MKISTNDQILKITKFGAHEYKWFHRRLPNRLSSILFFDWQAATSICKAKSKKDSSILSLLFIWYLL